MEKQESERTQNEPNETNKLIITGAGMSKGDMSHIQMMSLNKIKLAKNSRLSVSKEELDGLMASIKSVGLLQPIGVTPNKNGHGYEICYGNRRFMACSKLGLSKIAVIVHENKKAFDNDIKNLTENIQRRNISLPEAGRYMDLLRKEGLTSAEIAVRLGVTGGYVKSCLSAYSLVPTEYRGDLELKNTSAKKTPGKIGIKTANAIINAGKSFRLDNEETKALFKAAKTSDKFSASDVPRYAKAIKSGKKDFMKAVTPMVHCKVNFLITEEHRDELRKKYVDDGPFKAMNELFCAILKGEKNVRIEIKGRY